MLKCLTVKQKPQEFAFSVNQMSVKRRKFTSKLLVFFPKTKSVRRKDDGS